MNTESVTPLENTLAEGGMSNVIDLTELLAKSLAKRNPAAGVKSSGDNESGRRGKATLLKKAPAKPAARKRA